MTESKKLPPETLGDRVSRLMTEKGFNQTSFAEKVGMERSEMNRSLNNKRNFQPDELGWIAAALDTPVEELLEGLKLPAALEKTRNELQGLAARVLEAEAERDRATQALQASEAAFEEERRRWSSERADLMDQVRQATADAARDLTEARDRFAKREKGLLGKVRTIQQELSACRDQFGKVSFELNRHRQAANVLHQQLHDTQQAVAREQAAKVATGVLAGLAGAFLGGAVVGGSSTGYDEDE